MFMNLISGEKTQRVAAAASVAVGAMFLCAAAQGSVIVDASYYTGSRTTTGTSGSGNGLIWNPAAGNWSSGAFSIAWEITLAGSDYTYSYTVNTPSNAELSHWILQLSPEDAEGNDLENYWETTVFPNDEVGLTDSSSGNPGMPNSIFGVRFDDSGQTTTVTFTTPQVPVWGDFYAKDGGGTDDSAVYAYNIGFGTDPAADATNFINWIARPDGTSSDTPGEIPEPASLGLLGLGLLAMGAIRRRKTVQG